ncbi:zinc dependent phospholipase C family protein [Aliikangiella coralliicola]|uniref:Zinc dependent phospholipase C family protein n=1 Tax=Aliikangiella coralliicola TaxID=2592383 RepID=A0A545UH91_9GAMM|nr:zinc dependent phospholipase C family protein [Aliikangiella coralliicola]TQV88832.1 zinc dependent phospholipase C family protein [Aliikangiella coralliicola]
MKLKYLFAALVLLIGFNTNALELKTHLYIGEEILADLEDGKVTIQPFGEFEVDSTVVSRILANRDYFLLGTIGPDVLPDFLGGQITVHAAQGGWTTDDWLSYLYNASWYDNSMTAFYYGYLMHSAADVFSHTYVNSYAGDVFDLTDEDLLQVELRHKLLEMYIAKHQPARPISTSWKNTVNEVAIKSRLLDSHLVEAQYRASGTAKYLALMKEYENEAARLAHPINILKSSIHAVINKNIARQQHYQALIARYDSEHGETTEQIAAQQAIIDSLTPVAEFAVCEFIYNQDEWGLLADGSWGIVKTKHEIQTEKRALGLCRWKSEVDQAILGIQDAEELIRDLEQALANFFENNPDLAEAARALGLPEMTRSEAAEALVLVAALIVFGEELDLKTIALNAAFTRYRSYIVRKAGQEYIKANIQTAANIVDQKGLVETVKPIADWLACYGPVYTGEAGAVSPAVCEVKEGLDELSDRLQDELKDLVSDEELLNLYHSYQAFQNDVKALAVRLGKDIVKEILTDEQKEMIGWLTNHVSDASLTAAFSGEGNSARLLKITDIVERVKGDMYLRGDGSFDPQKFAPIFNSMQLSKIAFLGSLEMQRLGKLAGVNIIYGQEYYNYRGIFNILHSWIGNLDGNHQWMAVSPKLPRQAGFDDPRESYDRVFSQNGGLILWNNANGREKIFEKLFIGPIAPGIESPDLIGESNILPSYYESRNCYSDPFQTQGEGFEQCTPLAAWLIPILHVLN